ncbi:hypothetical protein K435DRAFT_653618 [Dendrothele bispora CBS 962.96]|uniref:Uncharacterized protein n=1 Tax=Dendrothele bispora (strain CBS 962.96) TaxID=1314807 RepID=A0A4S8MIH1_DENBC|nr:hypothetical protein K435DRAFT_653618 [Dendrothele bispora CBS 962.96]
MAAPNKVTTLNLSGKYLMVNNLPMDEILSLQGVSWIKRKAISAAGSPTIVLNHIKDSDSSDPEAERIEINTSLPGVSSTQNKDKAETRKLDWVETKIETPLFGVGMIKFRRVSKEEWDKLDVDQSLKMGWTEDTLENGVIQTEMRSDKASGGKGWTNVQIWGFEIINGERRYTRHVQFTGPGGESIKGKLVYDYGKLANSCFFFNGRECVTYTHIIAVYS